MKFPEPLFVKVEMPDGREMPIDPYDFLDYIDANPVDGMRSWAVVREAISKVLEVPADSLAENQVRTLYGMINECHKKCEEDRKKKHEEIASSPLPTLVFQATSESGTKTPSESGPETSPIRRLGSTATPDSTATPPTTSTSES